MSEKRLEVTPEMLEMLEEIRGFCENNRFCAKCPFHTADDPYNTCRLAVGMYPSSWDLYKMEVERDG